MVQICSSCLDKNSHLAEGGSGVAVPLTTSASHSNQKLNSFIAGGAENSVGGNNGGGVYGPSGISVTPTNHPGSAGIPPMQGANGGGPSEKSVANSDSMSNVRFKVRDAREKFK